MKEMGARVSNAAGSGSEAGRIANKQFSYALSFTFWHSWLNIPTSGGERDCSRENWEKPFEQHSCSLPFVELEMNSVCLRGRLRKLGAVSSKE